MIKRRRWPSSCFCILFVIGLGFVIISGVRYLNASYKENLEVLQEVNFDQKGRFVTKRFTQINSYTTTAIKSTNKDAVGIRFAQRRNMLLEMCKKLGLNIVRNDKLHKPYPWEYLVNEQYHLVWCNVFKAAASSWMYNFNLLAGYNETYLQAHMGAALVLARKKYPRQTVESLMKAFETSTSFLVVRHPLERLLSAYKDKIVHAVPKSHHMSLRRRIIKTYRKKWKQNTEPPYPTFEEFVRYILRSKKISDMHWVSVTAFCTPCMFDFDYIAHMETLQEDQEYIIKAAGLENIIKPEWKNQGVIDHQKSEYFSQLSKEQINELYKLYRYDFELFNYTLDGYLEMGYDKNSQKNS